MRTHLCVDGGWLCLDDGILRAPVPAPRIAVIGDSLTHMGGNGDTFTRDALADVGISDENLYFYGVIGKRTVAADSAGKTTAQNIADARTQLGHVDYWVIALGTNDRSSDVPYIRSTIQTVLLNIGDDPVIWIGLSSKAAATPADIATNNVIQEELRPGDVYADWDARIRSIDGGADPSPYWNTSDATHMPPLGYRERAKFYAEQVQAMLAGGGGGDGGGPFDRAPDFEDTFGGSVIDSAKWNVWDNTYLNYDWGDIRSSNADIVDGNLRQRVTSKASPITKGGRVRHWDTAYMVSHYRQQYGRWEMRAKIPTVANQSQGLWPAFWLRNNPSTGEIDIMESWGGPTRNRTRSATLESTSAFALHENTSGGGVSYNHPIEWRANPGQPSYSTAADFHVWTCDYMPDYLRIYFDGVLVADCRPDGDRHPRASQAHASQDLSWLWGPTFVGTPWEIRINFQMGDSYWSSDTEPATGALTGNVPAEYLIDYVRAWEYTP